jgi:hypothetical protein
MITVSLFGIGGGVAGGDNSIISTAGNAQPRMTPTEQLMYSTLRLYYSEGARVHWGSRFIYRFFKSGQTAVPAIVTNAHVLTPMKTCSFSFASRGKDGKPDHSSHILVTIQNFDTAWLRHPSADLAIIPIAEILRNLQMASKDPFIVYLDQGLIPTNAEFQELTPVEQVLTVDFPGQVWDDVHNLPIFHRGYTSTPPYIDFKGKPEFLIDFTTWPGASGSMVLLYNDQGWMDRRGNTMLGAMRTKLIGVVYGVATQDVRGNVLIENGPTTLAAQGQMLIPTNLGACIRASRILEFEPLLVSRGAVPPPGYNMRSN